MALWEVAKAVLEKFGNVEIQEEPEYGGWYIFIQQSEEYYLYISPKGEIQGCAVDSPDVPLFSLEEALDWLNENITK